MRIFPAAGAPHVDGVICFGDSDWWYHNRGHYDMQMMRQMAAHMPVLYVNSIGVRMPQLREGGMFLRRIRRKMQSLGRGLTAAEPNFSVFSPLSVPGRLGQVVSRPVLVQQVRQAARRLGIHHPLVWVACPTAATVVDRLRPAAVIYQRTDAYENLPGADAGQIRRLDRLMKKRADVTLFCSSYVMETEKAQCRNPMFVDHGVDFDRFAAAGRNGSDVELLHLDPLKGVGRPRIGFVGSIDSHTFDAGLFNAVVRQLPEVEFVLVGGCSLPEGWCRAPNVTHVGQRPYEQVAAYMAACDVLIMPWNRNDWIRACNPVKLKEYLAVGRPVVTTFFEELHRYDGFVRVAGDADSFAEAIRDALVAPETEETLRERVRRETWRAKGRLLLAELTRLGLLARETEVPIPGPGEADAAQDVAQPETRPAQGVAQPARRPDWLTAHPREKGSMTMDEIH